MLALELGGIWTLEAWLKRELHLSHDLWADKHLKISPIGSTIPIISDMTTIHDFAIDIAQILIGHLIVLAEVIVEHITTDGQVSIVE